MVTLTGSDDDDEEEEEGDVKAGGIAVANDDVASR
jgi:hypothetical protein